jgi:hypothetical protein
MVPLIFLRLVLQALQTTVGVVAAVAVRVLDQDPLALVQELEQIANEYPGEPEECELEASVGLLAPLWRRALARNRHQDLDELVSPGTGAAFPAGSQDDPDWKTANLIDRILSLKRRINSKQWLGLLMSDLEQQMDRASYGNVTCLVSSREFNQEVFIHWRFSFDPILVQPTPAALRLSSTGHILNAENVVLAAKIRQRRFPRKRTSSTLPAEEGVIPRAAFVDVVDISVPASLGTAYRQWPSFAETIQSATLRALGRHWGWNLCWEPSLRRCLDGHWTAFQRGLLEYTHQVVDPMALQPAVFACDMEAPSSDSEIIHFDLDGTVLAASASESAGNVLLPSRASIGQFAGNERRRALIEEIS